MAESEKLQQLDRRIASTVLTALSGLRDEISQRLREHTDSVEGKLQALEEVLPASFLAEEDLEPLSQAASGEARTEAFREIRDALAAIDGSKTQAEILGSLLASASGFCSRAAVFLVRSGGVQGWGGAGFPADAPEVSSLTFDLAEGSAWGRLAASDGSLELTPAECAPLCSQLESAVPGEAALIPLILSDRLAAALYVDRLGEGDRFDPAAVQSLAFVAAQAIELLPFRERAKTATLATASAAGAAGLKLWGEESAEEAVDLDETVVPLSAPDDADSGAAQEAEAAASEEAVVEAPALEEPEVEKAAAPASDFTLEPDDNQAEEAPAAAASESKTVAGPLDPAVLPGRARETEELSLAELERIRAKAEEEERLLQEAGALDETDVVEPASDLGSAASLDAGLVTEEIPITSQDEVTFDVSAAFDEPKTSEIDAVRDEPAAASAPPFDAGPIDAGQIDVSEDETVLIPMSSRSAEPAKPAPPSPPPVAPSPPSPRASDDSLTGTAAGYLSGPALVEPPSGLDGPGSAFQDFAPGMSKEEEAAHEEGRRLARLLVSEIRLYYEDQVEEGRRNRDIYRRLKEDIDRSRKMYEERIDEQVRESRDYFQEELVRILADGDEGALGL